MNRLSIDHLSKWRALYTATLSDFKRGAISEYDAMHVLMDLNFKSQALDVELLFFNRERIKWRNENGRNA
jgi:hypothetical protein